MSTHATSAHAHGHAPGHTDGHITVRTLLVIYAALIGLMLLTVGVATIDLGRANFLIAMGIAGLKVLLILLYFMHVRYSEKILWIASMATFLWFAILIGGLLNDYWTRNILDIPGK